jgi:hypothetical protein
MFSRYKARNGWLKLSKWKKSVCFPLRPDKQINQDQVWLTANEISNGENGKERV